MYHIVRPKSKTKSKKFQVVNLSSNGEPINSSEILDSKQACETNIIANKESTNIEKKEVMYFLVQDDTKRTPEAYTLLSTGERETDIVAEPRYIPGKNPKKKKTKKTFNTDSLY